MLSLCALNTEKENNGASTRKTCGALVTVCYNVPRQNYGFRTASRGTQAVVANVLAAPDNKQRDRSSNNADTQASVMFLVFFKSSSSVFHSQTVKPFKWCRHVKHSHTFSESHNVKKKKKEKQQRGYTEPRHASARAKKRKLCK